MEKLKLFSREQVGNAPLTGRQYSRPDSLSLVSRQSVLAFLLVLLTTVFGVGNAWAEEVTWSFKTLQVTSGTQDGISWETGKTGSATATACNATNGLVLYGVSSGGGYFQTTSATSGYITNVEIVSTAKKYTPKYTIYCSLDGSDWTSIESDISAGTKAKTIEGAYTYLKIANTTAATAQLGVTSITITYETSGGGGGDQSTPSAEPESNSIDVDAAGGSGTINVTYSNFEVAVSAVQFYDQTGESEVDAPSWMTAETDENNNIQYSVQANSGEARTAYLKVYALNDDSDELYSSLITISQAEYVAPFDGLKLTFDVSSNPGEWPTSNSTTTTNYTYTLNEVDYTFALNNVKSNSGYLMLTATAKLGLPAISGYKLVKVEAKNSGGCSPSTKVKVSSDINGENVVSGGSEQTWATQSSTYTYTLTGTEENTMYYLYVTNKNCQITELVLYYVEAEAAAVATPSISGEDNFLNSTEVSMTCATEGAAIYYTTTESAKATPATSGDWAAYDSENKPSFSATTTVWAAAKKDAAWSAVAEKTFTKATVLTVAQALAIINAWTTNQTSTQDYYVAGTVSTVTSLTVGGTGEYYISDDGTTTTQLQVYKGLWIDGAYFSSTDQLYVGDDVTVKGKLRKFSSYKELDQNNEVIAHKPIARLSWSDASYNAEIDGSNSFPTLTNTNSVSVTYSSSNTAAATINASTGAISLVGVGTTTITASFAGNESYKANSASYTLNVAAAVIRADISFEENGGSAVADLTQQSNLPNPLPAITKAGKNFGGWYTDSEFNTPAVAGAAVASTDAITLYAKWLEPYTVAQALAMIDELEDGGYSATEVYVSGIVCTASTSLYSSKYLRYYISADGTEDTRLYVFDGLDEDGAAFTDITDIQVLDEVVVYGKLQKYVKNEEITPEIAKDNVIYSLNRKADAGIAWTADEAEATIGEENTFPSLTNDNAVAVTYSSSETDYATIDASTGDITLVAAGQTTITATFAGDATYKSASVSYTLTVKPVVVHGSITYEENGGETVADVADATELPNPLPTTTKDGHKFLGWYTDSELTVAAVAGAALTGSTTLYAAWEEISAWADVYTSNVELSYTGSGEGNSKVIINEAEYPAQKVGSGSNDGSVVVTVPYGTHTLHFHAVAWNGKSVTITASGVENMSVSSFTLAADPGFKSSGTYTLENDPVGQYFVMTFTAVTEETQITFSKTAGDDKRFMLYGVNQEGGVLPVLGSIEISGDLGTKTGYKVGDALDLDGLTVEATYSLGGVAQSPVDITSDPELELTYDPLVEDQTEVTITASYKGQTDDITITGLDPVASADPKIYVSTLNVNFASVEVGESVPDAETVTVTLTNVASVTATLGGTNADAFSVSSASLTESGDITISILANTDAAASYSATLTISDGEGGADDKTVNLSFEVTELVVEDDVTGTWTLVTNATTLAAGKKVIIAQYVEADGAIKTMAGQASNNRSVIASTVAGTTLTPAVGTKVMTLADAGEGNFYLKTSDGEYLYNASTSSKSYLRTKAEEENVSWTIAVDAEGVATITSVENTNRTKMRYNPNTSGSPLFNCYASGQEDIALYMLEDDTPEPPVADYTRDVKNGNYGTICLPQAGTITGATLFEIASFENGMIYMDEVGSTMEAGKPYIFQATADQLNVTYTSGTQVAAGEANGLHGFYNLNDEDAQKNLDQNDGNYILYQNAYWLVSGRAAYIANYRAYIKIGEIENTPAPEPTLGQAPRRRVAMTVHGEQVATDIDNVQGDNVQCTKVMINGQLYIMYNGAMYNVQGQLVK